MIAFTLAILAKLVFAAYIVIISVAFGLLPSISDSWYKWIEYGERDRPKKPYLGRYFTIWCCLVPLFIIHPAMVVTDGMWFQFLVPITCLGLVFVGTAPQFKKQPFTKWHVIGAIVSAISALATCVLLGFWLETAAIMGLSFLVQAFTGKEDKTFWLEVGCFTAYIGSVLIKITQML